MTTHPLAGKLAPISQLADIPRLVTAYYAEHPDPEVRDEKVAFGTLGASRIVAQVLVQRDAHLATTEAICRYRKAQGIDGPLFLGIDTHAFERAGVRVGDGSARGAPGRRHDRRTARATRRRR